MTHVRRSTPPLTPDTNNLLILFTQLYPDSEVLRKVVVIKADKYDWYVTPRLCCCLINLHLGQPSNVMSFRTQTV